jgi:hypothetical protein
MPSRHHLAAALAAVIPAFAAAGCGLLGGSGNEVVTMYVAPETAPCKPLGQPESECLLVRSSPDAEWEPLVVGDIQGFSHELGHAYTLLVEVRELDRPRANGLRTEYRLVRVVKRERSWPEA